MTVLETLSRIPVGKGSPVGQLVCHPRLALVAGFDGANGVAHVWSCADGRLRELGTLPAERAEFGPGSAMAWHPSEPVLVAARQGAVERWAPEGRSTLDGVPPTAWYDALSFSPDGRALWAMPGSSEGPDSWARTDVLDLGSGEVTVGPCWGTGIAVHPAGGLVATMLSDQGATHVLFARVDERSAPASMHLLRRALILDVDGYGAPVFSADGRYFAIRGNSYEHTLCVYEFPSLRSVLWTSLGSPYPGHPVPEEWRREVETWSHHNTAFGAQPGVLWVGKPNGSLVEVDLDGQRTAEHEVSAGSPVTALGATAAGELVVADGGGGLMLLSVRADAVPARPADRALIAAFIESTADIPDEGTPDNHLVVTDGSREWDQDDLAAVVEATPDDPTWLRLSASLNTLSQP